MIKTKILHIEPTNVCTLKCPMCSRTLRGIDGPFHFEREWFPNLNIDLFDMITMCGTFGEPTNYKYLLDFIEFIQESNRKPWISICSNGNSHSPEWWADLAKALPKNNHSVTFSLDGVGRSHEMYRVGSKFDNIIRNASSFIKNGGVANWCMILFKHNEHEVSLAEGMSNSIGFKKFVVRPSYAYTSEFERPSIYDVKTRYELSDFSGEYRCRIHDGEIFVDCHGRVLPCCYMTSLSVSRKLAGVLLSVKKIKLSEMIKAGYFDRILSKLHKVEACSFCKVMVHNMVGRSPEELIQLQKNDKLEESK